MAQRKAAESSTIMLVVAIIVGLAVALILLKGGSFVSQGQGTITGIGQNILSRNKGAFGQACREWKGASEGQQRDPGFILGAAPNPASIPGAAGAYGNKFSCCRGRFEEAAKYFRSKQGAFSPQPDLTIEPYAKYVDEWNLWSMCYSACLGFSDVYDLCAQTFQGGEGDRDFINCLENSSTGC